LNPLGPHLDGHADAHRKERGVCGEITPNPLVSTRYHDGPSITPAVTEAKRLAKKCGKGTYVVIYGATSAETLQWDGKRFVNRGRIK
jgi:hypothetical protein